MDNHRAKEICVPKFGRQIIPIESKDCPRQMEYEHDVATSVAESNAEVFKVCLGQKYDRLSALAGGQNVVPQLGNWVITLQQFRTFGLAP